MVYGNKYLIANFAKHMASQTVSMNLTEEEKCNDFQF